MSQNNPDALILLDMIETAESLPQLWEYVKIFVRDYPQHAEKRMLPVVEQGLLMLSEQKLSGSIVGTLFLAPETVKSITHPAQVDVFVRACVMAEVQLYTMRGVVEALDVQLRNHFYHAAAEEVLADLDEYGADAAIFAVTYVDPRSALDNWSDVLDAVDKVMVLSGCAAFAKIRELMNALDNLVVAVRDDATAEALWEAVWGCKNTCQSKWTVEVCSLLLQDQPPLQAKWRDHVSGRGLNENLGWAMEWVDEAILRQVFEQNN